MFKRLPIAAALLAATAVVVSAIAPRASAATPPRTDAVVAGHGTLVAHGTGVVAVKGRMDYRATADEGVLLVKDLAGDAQVDVEGVGGSGEWRGFTAYFGFHGSAHVTGSEVAVIVVGRDIDLRVAGRGWAYLKGRGTYSVNGHDPKPWTETGAFVGMALDPAIPVAPAP